MRVLSVQVGQPGTLPWRGREVRSAIFKEPRTGPVMLGPIGFEGDVQADRRVHGGPDKAVCVHPSEHFADWEELVGQPLPPGAFGENLRTEGMLEPYVNVGDVYRVGAATVQVSQPRGPCFKLAARWGTRTLPAYMARQQRSGFYFRVLRAGAVAAGDPIERLERNSDVSIAEVMRVTYLARDDIDAVQRVIAVPDLAEDWRDALQVALRRRLLPLEDFGT